MLIELLEVNAGYGRKTVLHDVTLEFDGGAAGLLGPNGAGKTTLLKTLLGFIPPLAGSVKVLDLALPRQARAVRSRVGYMPETEAFIPGINAVNFVAYMGELSGLPRAASVERAHEVLQYVGLGESRYRNLETYSMGMKQRAKLAQAIVHDPAILLLDEPTNGMDPQGRQDMLELVNDLAQNKGMSVILCSHLLKDVEAVCAEIIVMGSGRVISKRMRTAPERGADFFCSIRLRGDYLAYVRELNDRGIKAVADETGSTVYARRASTVSSSVFFEAAAACGCVVHRLEHTTEKLEDVFVQVLGELENADL